VNRIEGRRGGRRTARSWVVAGTVLGCTLSLALALPAGAATDDPTQGGLWYYNVPGLAQVHASGVTGAGITVAVIDGPINPAAPDLVGANLITTEDSSCDDNGDGVPEPATTTAEHAEHATQMVSLIVGTGAGIDGQPGVLGVAPGATVRHYAFKDDDSATCLLGDDLRGMAGALDQAVADGAQVINISQSAPSWKPEVLAALARAERAGVVVVAASNNRGGTDLGWPASANGVVSVESADVNQLLNPDAVTNPLLTVVAPGEGIRALTWADGAWNQYLLGNGSSYATAWTSGVLALAWSAHPQATGNQMIQALVRTTGQATGEPTRVDDHWGYGTVSVSNLLAADPTTFPDVNPLLRDTPDAFPAYADIVSSTPDPGQTTAPAQTTKPTTTPGNGGDTPAATTSPLLLIAGGLLVLLIIIAIVIAILLARRRPTGSIDPTAQYRP